MRSSLVLAVLPFALAACQQAPENSVDAPAATETLPVETGGGAGGSPDETPVPSDTPTASDDAGAHAIPVALQGRWGMVPADCTSTRGDAKGLLTITDGTLKFYESVGKLGAIKSRKENSLRADFAFSGEGMTWTRDVSLSVSGDKLTRTERGSDEPGSGGPFTYTKCAA